MQSSIFGQQCATPSTGARISDAGATKIYVNAAKGLDSNSCGHRSRPCKTITGALSQATDHEVADVIVNPGTYREAISLPSQFGEGSSRTLVIEAAQTGTAIVDGADQWRGWISNGDGTYFMAWPYTWGYAAQPFLSTGGPALGCLGLRREMAFINGVQLTQVLQGPLTQPGTFRVIDGQGDSNSGDTCPELSSGSHAITVRPPSGTNMSVANVEIAVRNNLFTTSAAGAQNLELKGLVFQHDNNGANISGFGAIRISGDNTSHEGANILLDGVTARYNNWQGLVLSANLDITIRNSTFTRNGENGVEVYRPLNLLFAANTVTYNNWRGSQGGLTGWDADGMKVVKAHYMEVDNSSFNSNFTGGLWFDTDNENLCIVGDSFNENTTNGLYFEATQGPALIYRSVFHKNHGHGLQAANSARITVRQSTLYDNGGDALFIGGSATVRDVSNWQRPGVAYHLLTQDWVLDGVNLAAGPDTAPGSALIGTSLSTLNSFTTTLFSDYNDWFAPNSSALFNVPGQGNHTLGGWHNLAGQDAHSTQAAVNSEALPPSPICIGPDCAGNAPAAEKPARP
ncbi:MAG: right-handed parallel beta-helix repeat-containing protein [Candidatus Acidiferrales bacterium]